MKETVVVFSGGGTGGHLYPALALAEALQQIRPDVRPRYVGARRGIEARVLSERGVDPVLLDVEGLSRTRLLHNVSVLSKLAGAVRQTVAHYRAWKPRLVVVTGGYAAAPAGLAAVVLRLPLALQEQNSWPGLTTRLLARWARQVHVAFPESVDRLPRGARSRARVSGNPIRRPGQEDPTEARKGFGLSPDLVTVLVAGGSQGSRALNDRFLAALRYALAQPSDPDRRLQVLWSTGPTHEGAVREGLAELGAPEWVHAVPYIHDMTRALRAADLAVSRAGAMTTSEYLAAGLPALLIPLPTAAADHQTHNARALADAGVAVHLSESRTDGPALWRALAELVEHGERRRTMRSRALERSRPQAASEIAEALASLLPEQDHAG